MRHIAWISLLLWGCRSDSKDTELDETVTDTEAVDFDGDGYNADEDCDDNNSVISPGALEICDGIDNDCDGEIDEGVTSTFYADSDGDGFGDPGASTEACDLPGGHTTVGNDCDDSDPKSYPAANERCDGIDNDCDGEIDEDVLVMWHADADADGYGDPDAWIEDCDPPNGYVSNTEDCNDLNAAAYPGAEEVCDDVDNDCDDVVDEGVTNTFYQDADGDGFGLSDSTTDACSQPTGYAPVAGDCDDSQGTISPNATELCDGVDNDCDGDTDEDDAADAPTWYADDDSDGYGDASDVTVSCSAPTGHVADATDCNDATASANPGQSEVCDSIDNDCDGETDENSATDASTWYADNDGDGYGGTSSTTACSQPSGFASNSTDCDDGESLSNPGETEVCDDIDNDCDGDVDEGLTTTYYADADEDGYGSSSYTVEACEEPSGYVTDATDCDDGEASANPGEGEVCDDIDNDCDGDVDEGVQSTWYLDTDGDGYGGETTVEACEAPDSTYVADSGDCDDDDVAYHPDAALGCDGEDYNCDGDVDNDGDGDGYADEACGGDDCVDDEPTIYPDSNGLCAQGEDCLEILTEGRGSTDGTYTIDPDGFETGADPFEVTCDMTTDGGGWTNVVDHDFSTDSCPGGWSADSSLGACYRGYSSGGASASETFDTHGITYSEVLGSLEMYQYASCDAFHGSGDVTSTTSLEGIYVDGASITHGASGSRTHIFTHAIGLASGGFSTFDCPAVGGISPPSHVGTDYLCETSNTATGSWTFTLYTTAMFSGDVWQSTLSSATTDDIEVRLMADQGTSDEEHYLGAIELWIR